MKNNETKTATQAVIFYLYGLSDGGVDLGHDTYALPPELSGQVKCVMEDAARADTEADQSASTYRNEFEQGGKWHRAAIIAMRVLDRESRAMTAGWEYPKGLPWGDRMHAALLGAMRTLCKPLQSSANNP